MTLTVGWRVASKSSKSFIISQNVRKINRTNSYASEQINEISILSEFRKAGIHSQLFDRTIGDDLDIQVFDFFILLRCCYGIPRVSVRKQCD